MASRGARNFVITSRSGVKTGYQKWKLDTLSQQHVVTKVSKLDVSDIDEAEQLLKEAVSLGPIGGIFHLAAVSSVFILTISFNNVSFVVCISGHWLN